MQFGHFPLDYVYFTHGLGLFLAAAEAWKLQRGLPGDARWRWLTLFGMLQGLCMCLSLAAISLADFRAFSTVRWALAAAAFLCLAEFGRLSSPPSQKRGLGWWVFFPLVSPAVIGAMTGSGALNSIGWYTLVFAGGLWAASALAWRSGGCARRRPSLVAGLAMAGYAVSCGVMVPRDPMCTAFAEFRTASLDWEWALVLLLRGALSLALAAALHAYAAREEGSPPLGKTHARWRSAAVVAPAVALVCGWGIADRVGSSYKSTLEEHLLALASVSASSLDQSDLMDLKADDSDIQKSSYSRLKEHLMRMRRASSRVRFYYLLRKVESRVLFMVDSEPQGSPDESPPGQEYSEIPPAVPPVFENRVGVVEGPYTDRWGTWVSGFVPLVSDGSVFAVLGIDVKAEGYMALVSRARLAVVCATAMAMAFLACYCVSMSRREEYLAALSAARARPSDLGEVGGAHPGRAGDFLPAVDGRGKTAAWESGGEERLARPGGGDMCAETAAPREPRQARVLVAEDNATNQLVALAILRKLGCQAEAVANGAEAVAAVMASSYDLVFMDCQMPEMDGYDATREIRKAEGEVLRVESEVQEAGGLGEATPAATGTQGLRRPRIPIIAMTANSLEGDREICLEAGMDDYITKPFEHEEIQRVLGCWVPGWTQRAGLVGGSRVV